MIFRFHLKKFRSLKEMASLRAAGYGHQNLVMRIPGALKIYEFYLHLQEYNLFFRFDVKNSIFLTRGCVAAVVLEHQNLTMRIRGALKSCHFSVHAPGDFSKFMLHFRKILLRRWEDVFRPRSWSTKIMRRVFSEH